MDSRQNYKAIHFVELGLSIPRYIGVQPMIWFCFTFSVVYLDTQGFPGVKSRSRLCIVIILHHNYIVCRDHSLTTEKVLIRTEQPTPVV